MSADLTKWPCLLIHGTPVTQAQADEIIVRTDDWMLSANDRDWIADVARTAGITLDPRYAWPQYESVKAFKESHGVLDLSYIHNNQIVSSWIGGPHGWCSWEGTIGCSSFNIGKWPTVEEVQSDLDAIAAAFPYLTFDMQLVADEGAAGYAAAQWVVGRGVAKEVEPSGKLLREPTDLDESVFMRRLFGHGGERGVSLGRLAQAIAACATP